MKLEEIKSEDLKRLLAVKSCKLDFKDVTEDDLRSIKEINLSGKRFDGTKSDIDLEIISLLPSIEMLGISDFHISQEIVDRIIKNRNLYSLEFTDCTFDHIDFGDINPDFNLRLKGIKFIPFKYPKLRKINIAGSIVDFGCFDLTDAEILNILDSKVFCIKDLDDFDNLRSVNFDGSTLYGENEKIIPEIKVSKDTTYSHRKNMSLYNRLEK